jgi:hypothetical protein
VPLHVGRRTPDSPFRIRGFLGIASTDTTWLGKSGIYTAAGRVHVTARQQPDPLGFETGLQALARELDDPGTSLANYRKRRQALENWYIDEADPAAMRRPARPPG